MTVASLALLALPAAAQNADDSGSFTGAAHDAWLAGKVEMAYTLNTELSPFEIDTHVDNGMVTLKGTVDSDVERDLAEQIAQGVDGVESVSNELRVEMQKEGAAASRNEHRDFPSWFDDATTTAAVKSRLIANSNTKGLQIDVDTRNDVVTLSGRVATGEQKELAEQIASNTRDVDSVRNLLVVDES
jgi:osmotically-inducible protein OsmY